MKDLGYIHELTSELLGRLPELEWKINSLTLSFINRSTPKELFKKQYATTLECMDELKKDIYNLSLQNSNYSAYYLAERIKQKISVLVGLCRIKQKNEDKQERLFSIAMLNTRQQWLHSLEENVNSLIYQQQALNKALQKMLKNNAHSSAVLSLKAEVGAVEKKLTIAKEALTKAQLNR